MDIKGLSWIIMVVIVGASFGYGLEIIKPLANAAQTNQNVVFAWNTVDADYYVLHISPNISIKVNYTYYTIRLDPGKYSWYVESIKNNISTGQSANINLTVLEKPKFDIKIEKSQYYKDRFVKLLINAPLHSELIFDITGPEDLTYNPKNLTNLEWYVRLTSLGSYKVDATLKYYDYNKNLVKYFDLSEYDLVNPNASRNISGTNLSNQINSTSNVSATKKTYLVEFKITDIYQQGIKDSVVSYISNKTEERFLCDEQGRLRINLTEGKYHFSFSKEGFENKSFALMIDSERKVNIILKKQDSAKDKEVKIIYPQDKAYIASNVLTIKFNSSEQDCILLLNILGTRGWIALQGKGKSLYKDFRYNNTFQINRLPVGEYKAMVKCKDGQGRESKSNIVQFKLDSSLQEEKEEIIDLLNKYDEINDKIDSYNSNIKNMLERAGITGDIKRAKSRLDELYNKVNAKNQEATKAYIDSELDKIYKILPVSINLEDNELLVNLPSDNFANVLNSYLMGELLGTRQKKLLINNLRELQSKYYVKENIYYLGLSYKNFDKTLTFVDKSLESSDNFKIGEDDVVEFFPNDLAKRNPSFITSVQKEDENFFKLQYDKYHIKYYFDEYVAKEDLKKTSLFIYRRRGFDNKITGMAVLNPLSNSYLSFGFIIALVVAVLGMLFVPGSRFYLFKEDPYKKISGHLNIVINLLNKGNMKEAFMSYEMILNNYNKLQPSQKAEFSEIMGLLERKLNDYLIERELDKAKKLIRIQENLFNDGSLYAEIKEAYERAQEHSYDDNPYEEELNRINDYLEQLKK